MRTSRFALGALTGTALLVVLIVALTALAARAARQREATSPDDAHVHPQAEHGAIESMTGSHQHHAGAHMKLSASRPANAADRERAEGIVHAVRAAMERYKDARAAEADGYQPFLAHLPLPEYHFTNYRHGFLEAFTFNPSRPTSLLYRKSGDEYKLVGAMYTAPKRFSEEQLNERVPLSVAQWHAHVNICMPQKDAAKPDWRLFGFQGTIADSAACDERGGRFFPQIFGWMVHVYPYERDVARIWGHAAR